MIRNREGGCIHSRVGVVSMLNVESDGRVSRCETSDEIYLYR